MRGRRVCVRSVERSKASSESCMRGRRRNTMTRVHRRGTIIAAALAATLCGTRAQSQILEELSIDPSAGVVWLGGSGNWSIPANWSMSLASHGSAFPAVYIDGGNPIASWVNVDIAAQVD